MRWRLPALCFVSHSDECSEGRDSELRMCGNIVASYRFSFSFGLSRYTV